MESFCLSVIRQTAGVFFRLFIFFGGCGLIGRGFRQLACVPFPYPLFRPFGIDITPLGSFSDLGNPSDVSGFFSTDNCFPSSRNVFQLYPDRRQWVQTCRCKLRRKPRSACFRTCKFLQFQRIYRAAHHLLYLVLARHCSAEVVSILSSRSIRTRVDIERRLRDGVRCNAEGVRDRAVFPLFRDGYGLYHLSFAIKLNCPVKKGDTSCGRGTMVTSNCLNCSTSFVV